MAEVEASTAASGGDRLRKASGGVLCAFTLLFIGVLAFSIRLFSFLSKSGIYEFWNWFDDRTWYPLGRVIGGTVYPGLTLTAGTIWWLLNSINIPLSVETVCVFTAPIFSANASWATYLLTKEAKGHGAGLMAATILAMVRLMLVLAPAACILSGIALSEAFNVLTRSMKFQRPRSDDGLPAAGDITPGTSNTAATITKNGNITKEKTENVSKGRPSKKNRKEKEWVGSSPVRPEKEEKLCVLPAEASAMGILFLIILCGLYVVHCVWAAAEAYSAPSIVLTSHSHEGLHIFDDFRESYAWLRHNTEVDDKVASWWD
ncbi:hypothetical protein ACQ4PT_049269 [Festuca glaucescens]